MSDRERLDPEMAAFIGAAAGVQQGFRRSEWKSRIADPGKKAGLLAARPSAYPPKA
jgi:hypothetical protein